MRFFLFNLGQEVETVDEDLVGIGEAAERLNTSQTTLRRRIRDAAVPVYVQPLASPRRFDLTEEPMPAAS